ncbi:Flp pilus assembly protein CpaB [Granulosicoccaceae sp. 1_MG-2023]|nr:Flp pilus assembly protein CpaB [Granulosicoccaceae sp. 1_MG-2023]
MISRQSLFMLVVALGLGFLATVFANRWLQGVAEQSASAGEEAEVPTVMVMVAKRDIPYGAVIEKSDLKETLWPEDLAPADTFASADEVLNKLANVQIHEGEPLFKSKFVDKLDGSTLSALIAPNKRAITVRVNDVIGVAGFLLPGNRVDVLASRKQNGRVLTRTALENLKVLAVDQTATPDKDQPVVVRAVTLEATLDESVVLVGATQEGSVQLVLRNPLDGLPDAEAEAEPAMAAAKVQAPLKPPLKLAKNARTAQAAQNHVTVIRGMKVSSVSVRN